MSEQKSAVVAVDFKSRKIYEPSQNPYYACWVSFFPGENGRWYIGYEEVTRPDKPLPLATDKQWFAMQLPEGYDKSEYLLEAVILESADDMKTWHEISRQPYRHQHSVHQFATARTADGRFIRFVWAGYSLEPGIKPNDNFYVSADNGKTWQLQPPIFDEHFVTFPHRLRTLRDGTLVLCCPFGNPIGTAERPVRNCMDLNATQNSQMMMLFSFDDGRTWEGPLPILPRCNTSETDFVELPSGDLLVINNSIFNDPGRQFIYRNGRTFTPAPMERAINDKKPIEPGCVPETVCLVDGEILIGCQRTGFYSFSDDLGLTWQPLEGIPMPEIDPALGSPYLDQQEVYQPWIHYLGDGRVVCAGHLGGDMPLSRDRLKQYISLHSFNIKVNRKTKNTKIIIERDYDENKKQHPNAYTLTLSCDDKPLADKPIEFWYVERGQPGSGFGPGTLDEKIKAGGKLLKLKTNEQGRAHITLSHLDKIEDKSHSYQLIARFNHDRADTGHKPCQTFLMNQYAVCRRQEPLKEL